MNSISWRIYTASASSRLAKFLRGFDIRVFALLSCALNSIAFSQSTIMSWGDNSYGQCDTPAGKFNRISAGGYHNVGLRSDGVVICWGRNDYGQCDVPVLPSQVVVAIAAGGFHTSCIARVGVNGTLVCWGRNDSGQSTCGQTISLGETTGLSAGWAHNLVLENYGAVYGVGDNTYGQSSYESHFHGAAAGGWHNVGHGNPGYFAYSWGLNNFGQAGLNVNYNTTDVAAGLLHTAWLRGDEIIMFGNNDYGQCSVPETERFSNQQAVLGGYHTISKKYGGSWVAWGRNDYGQCDIPLTPTGKFVQVSAGLLHTVALRPPCKADIDESLDVDGGDLARVLLDCGPCLNCDSDLDGDGLVSSSDIGLVLIDWGQCD